MACRPIIVSYPGIVPSSFPKDFCCSLVALCTSVQFSLSVISNILYIMGCSTTDFPVHHYSHSLLKLIFIKLVMPPNNVVFCLPLCLLPLIFPSIRVFSNESVFPITWPKCWRISFSIGPYKEYLGLISFRMDWLDLLAVQATLKSLVQYHSSKPSVLWYSAFFMVQLSHPPMTSGKKP